MVGGDSEAGIEIRVYSQHEAGFMGEAFVRMSCGPMV